MHAADLIRVHAWHPHEPLTRSISDRSSSMFDRFQKLIDATSPRMPEDAIKIVVYCRQCSLPRIHYIRTVTAAANQNYREIA